MSKRKTPVRILFINDSEGDVLLLQRQFTRTKMAIECRRVSTPETLREALTTLTWDIVLSDYALSGFKVLEALSLTGSLARDLSRDLPLIVVSGAIGEEAAVEVMRAGARDFFLKDRLERLVPAVERELKEASVRREQRQAEEELEMSARKYRALFDGVADAIYISDFSGNIIDANKSACVRLGYTRLELLKKKITDFDPDETPAGIKDRMEKIKRLGSQIFERMHTARDGHRIPVEVSARIIQLGGREAVLSVVRDVSERKQAEERLRISEEKYRVLVENIGSGIFQSTMDGKFLYANPAMLAMTGYGSLEEFLNQPTTSLYADPADRTRFVNALAAHGAVRNLEVRAKRKDGSSFWVSLSALLLGERDGGPALILGIAQDVSARKQAEEDTRRLEEKFRELVENFQEIMYTVDRRETITYISPSVRSLGYVPEDLIGRPVFDFFHPDDVALLKKNLGAVREGEAYSTEYRVRQKNGEYRWIRTSSRPLSAEGRIIGVQGLLFDVTDRRKAEEALRESEERYRGLVENSLMGIGISSSSRILFANDALLSMLGYSSLDELKAVPLIDLVAPVSRAMIGERREKIERGETVPPVFEYSSLRQDGSVRILMASSSHMDAGGQLITHTLFQDITERKRADAALRENDERLSVARTAAGLGIYDFDGVTGAIHWDERMRELWGLGPKTRITYHLLKSSIHPQDRAYALGCLRRAIDPKGPGRYEAEFRITNRRDGREHWIAAAGQVTFSGGRMRMRRLVGIVQDITERKRSDAALRESEERFRMMFQHAATGMVIVGTDFRFRKANPYFCRMVGYTEEELLSRSFQDVTFPEDRPVGADLVRETIDGLREMFHLEKRYVRHNGEVIWGLVSSTLIRDEQGQPLHFITQIQDVTERNRAQETLRLREIQLVNAMKMADLGDWEYDVATDTFTFNDNFYAIFRTTVAKVGGYTMRLEEYARRFLHPDDRVQVGIESQDALTTDDPHYSRTIEHRILYEDGTIGHIAVRIFIVKDKNGKTIKTYGVNQNITRQKKAQEALRVVSARYQAILSSVPDIIMEVDTAKTYTWANEAGRQFFGDDVVGHNADYYFIGEQDVYEKVNPLFQGDEITVYIESWQRRRDGEKRLLAWWCRVLKDEEDLPVGALSTAWDITERKMMEDSLRESEEKYRLLHESAGMAIGYYSPEGVVLTYNKTAAKNMGGVPEDYIGKSLWELFPKEDADFYFARIKNAMASEVPQEYEDCVTLPAGKQWLRSTFSRIADAAGRVAGIQIISADMTGRKRMEEALQWELSLNSALAELSAPLIAPETTMNGVSRAVLDQALRLTMSANGFVALIDPETGDCVMHSSDALQSDTDDIGLPRPLLRDAEGNYPGLMGYALTTRAGFFTNDPSSHPTYADPALGHVSLDTFLAVPVLLGHELIGQIAIANAGRDYTERDLDAVRRIANYFALGVQSKRAEERVKASLKEKIVLLKEIHHRIKNNLQVVMSLLNLQTYHLTDPKAQALFRENQLRIRSMALVHERLYQSSDLSHVEFREYITKLAVDLFRAYRIDANTIRLQVKADDISLGIDASVPCGLIINELLLNSLKHAFPKGRKGTITVSLERCSGEQLLLTVADDGIGLDKNVDLHGSKSLGYSLVVALIEQLGGTMQVAREGGTKISIQFRGRE